jgi:hypothetical protein
MQTVSMQNALGQLYFTVQNYASAKPLLQRVYERFERWLGTEYADTLAAMENLALCCESAGTVKLYHTRTISVYIYIYI